MDVKGEVLLQLFNQSKLKNGTKTFLEPIFSLFVVNFKKLGFSSPLTKFAQDLHIFPTVVLLH